MGFSPPAHFLKHVLEPPGKEKENWLCLGRRPAVFLPVQFSVRTVPGSVGCSVVGHDFSGLPTSDPKKRNSSLKVLRP